MKRGFLILMALVMAISLLAVEFSTSADIATASAASSKLIAFTFDDGPSAYTTRLLDGLKELGVKATFFVNGANGPYCGAAYHTAKLQRMAADGHQIANHTYSHYVPFDSLSAASVKSEADKVNTYLYEAIGGNYQSLVRTPGGAVSSTIKRNINAPIILWDVDTLDWKYRNATTVYNNILNNARDGSVVLLHDIYSTSVTGALDAIKALKKQGYEFVTVSELFRRRGITLKNGSVYTHAPNKGTTLAAYRAPSLSYTLSSQIGKARVSLSTADSGITLCYTTDGTTPTLESARYTAPFDASYGTTVTVAGFDKYGTRTPIIKETLKRQYEGVFDAVYYADNYPLLKEVYGYDEERLLNHFLLFGLNDGKQASPVFSIDYYMSRYADLQKAFGENRLSYVNHFMTHGMKEGRRASEQFDPVSYRLRYPDLRKAFGNSWQRYYLHYERNGIKEQRNPINCSKMIGYTTVYDGINYTAVYDYNVYVSRHTDIKRVFGYDDAAVLKHFVQYGMKEGRQASEHFSVQSYRLQYADLRNAYGNSWKSYYLHYLKHGLKEGRTGIGCNEMRGYKTVYNGVDYAAVYDYNFYTNRYADIKRAFGYDDAAVLKHFVQYGMKEGRQASEQFHVQTYREKYSDLRNAFGNRLTSYYTHYLQCGIREGRTAV